MANLALEAEEAHRVQPTSIYDLREDEQLSLAIQRSLSDDNDPEFTPGGRRSDNDGPPRESPSSSGAADASGGLSAVAVPVAAGPDGSPELTGARSHRCSTPELTGAPAPTYAMASGATGSDGAAGPLAQLVATPVAPPDDASAIDNLAVGPLAARGLEGLLPPPERSAASAPSWRPPPEAAGRRPPTEAAGQGGEDKLPPEVETQVRRALELASARRFEDAERCLAQISDSVACAREVTAAWEAVAMCKQFHAKV